MNEIEFPSLEELVAPEHSAIIAIDMQNDFCSEKGVAIKGAGLSGIKATAKRMGDFLTKARESGVKIIYTQYTISDWDDSPAWTRAYKDFPGGSKAICAKGSWGAEWFEGVEELWPRPTDYVVEKHRYDGFVGTQLDQVLRSIGIRTVIITGTATDVCVDSTVRGALHHEYHVVVVSDCVCSTRPEHHKISLETMKTFFATVVTSSELLKVWSQRKS